MSEKFAALSFIEVLAILEKGGNLAGSDVMSLYDRLMDIAFMDHGVPSDHREAAEQVAGTIKNTILESSRAQGHHELITAFEAAANEQLNLIRRFGRGTVMWELEERALVDPEQR